MVAQGQNIAIGVLVPDEAQGFAASQSNMLQSRMERLCTMNDIAVVNDPEGFFLYPTITIVSDEVAEGGMRNINTVKAEITLSVRRIGGDVVASTSKTLSGSGYSQSQSFTSLIQSLDVTEPVFTRFISEAKAAIVKYYQSPCTQIMSQAERSVSTHDYNAAIAILYRIPVNAPCFANVSAKMSEYYALYQSQLCNTLRMNVESALSTHDYEYAASLLSEIDPSSECYEYAYSKFRYIEKEVTKLEKRDWNFKMKQYEDAVNIEKHIINAVSGVANAYYSSKQTVHYTQIIK